VRTRLSGASPSSSSQRAIAAGTGVGPAISADASSHWGANRLLTDAPARHDYRNDGSAAARILNVFIPGRFEIEMPKNVE